MAFALLGKYPATLPKKSDREMIAISWWFRQTLMVSNVPEAWQSIATSDEMQAFSWRFWKDVNL